MTRHLHVHVSLDGTHVQLHLCIHWPGPNSGNDHRDANRGQHSNCFMLTIERKLWMHVM